MSMVDAQKPLLVLGAWYLACGPAMRPSQRRLRSGRTFFQSVG